MAHLYEALTWTIDEPDRPLEFVFHNDGEVLAKAAPVAPRPNDSAGLPYANPHAAQPDSPRTLLCVAGPDGAPYFYVEHWRSTASYNDPSVVAANGQRLGSIVAKSEGGLKGMFRLRSGRQQFRYLLRDEGGATIVVMRPPPMEQPFGEGTLTGAEGDEIGRFRTDRSPHGDRRRRHSISLTRPLAEPARTLTLASMLGLEIVIPR
ncbi:hypothetical protein SMC26_25030 [Actinomadura fulvescens]|uniref:Uncharacterized protein n=1 Tax=Actinomadura fulvescens TaxID=46160 RepID=A0ABP6CDE9_9ACTN